MSEDNEQPLDTRSDYERAVDMAWRVENMAKLLRGQGDDETADKVENSIRVAFTLDPNDDESARAVTGFLGELVEQNDNYDSGHRKYEEPTVQSQ